VEKMANNFFESPHYGSLMYMLIILVSILILFSFVNLTEKASQGVTAYAVSSNNSSSQRELYSSSAYLGYIVLIGIVVILVILISIILGKTISRGIKKEFTKQSSLEEDLKQSEKAISS
jgi:hypothetical protein